MEKTKNGLVIVKKLGSIVRGHNVALTRKTTLTGEIRYGVVLENRRCRSYQKISTFTAILPAWKVFKALSRGAKYKVDYSCQIQDGPTTGSEERFADDCQKAADQIRRKLKALPGLQVVGVWEERPNGTWKAADAWR